MTDRVRTLEVLLSQDTRDDDAEEIMNAIRFLRGVEAVSLGPVVDGQDHVNRAVAKRELMRLLLQHLTFDGEPLDKSETG